MTSKTTTTRSIPQYKAAIEAGGTSFVAGFVPVNFQIGDTIPESNKIYIPTLSSPIETLKPIKDFFSTQSLDACVSLGIACFGPVDLKSGALLNTPKTKWSGFKIVDHISSWFPQLTREQIHIETDVNTAAIAESLACESSNSSTNKQKPSLVYITCGTGVGVGIVLEDSKPHHGILHPEGGHQYAPLSQYDIDYSFKGVCPFHGNCIEGMMSSGSILARCQNESRDDIDSVHDLNFLSDDDPIWEPISHYLAHLCINITLLIMPEKIVFGGGVANRKCLFDLTRKKILQLASGYIQTKDFLSKDLSNYLAPPKLDDPGLVGAFFLA